METNLELEKDEPIVIADECGDSMWDVVLARDVKAGNVKSVSKNATSLLQSLDAVQVYNAHKN